MENGLMKNAERSFSLQNDSRGVVYIEFIYTIPFLFALILATVEFGNMLHIRQSVNFIARESALLVFRECAPYDNEASRNACVRQMLGRMEGVALRTINPSGSDADGTDVDLIISIYEWDSINAIPRLLIQHPANGTPAGFESKIAPDITTDPGLRTMVENQGRVVIAEVDVFYAPQITRNIGYVDFTDTRFYEIAMY